MKKAWVLGLPYVSLPMEKPAKKKTSIEFKTLKT